MNEKSRSYLLPWVICGIAALFYCYNYFLRVSPSVMMPDLLQHFEITATQFGALTAFYYYAYDAMQLPVGVILDRFGARIVLFFASLVCVGGLGLFMIADGYYSAAFGRFMIGFGASFSYITVLKLGTLWLPPNRFALVAGMTTSFGMMAAVFSKKYLTLIVENYGYQDALWSTFILGFFLSAIILLVVRDKPKQTQNHHAEQSITFAQISNAIFRFVRSSQMWLIGAVGLLMYLPASVFLDLWDIEYLKIAYGLQANQATTAASMIFVGWIVASPLIGALSDHIRKRKMPLLIATSIAFVINCIIFYGPTLSTPILYTLLFVFGMCCGSHPLCFSLSKENNPANVTATAASVTNTIIMAGGVIFQPLVGYLLDWHWDGTFKTIHDGALIKHMPVYSAGDYTWALSIMPIAMLISVFLTMYIKETHCKMPETSDEADAVQAQAVGAKT